MVGGLGVDSESIAGEVESEGRHGTVLPSRRRKVREDVVLCCHQEEGALYLLRASPASVGC